MNKMYENLRDMIENEIEGIVKIGELNQSALCNLDKLVDIAKDIEEIDKYHEEKYGYSGYSGRMYNDGRDNRRDYDWDRYDDGRYETRKRATDGYVRYEGDMKYSGDMGNKDHMLSLMKQAMEQATSQEERDEIMKMIKKMEK